MVLCTFAMREMNSENMTHSHEYLLCNDMSCNVSSVSFVGMNVSSYVHVDQNPPLGVRRARTGNVFD